MNVSWRNVLDCKTPGQVVTEHIQWAAKLNYEFAAHNDRVYRVFDGIQIGVVNKNQEVFVNYPDCSKIGKYETVRR